MASDAESSIRIFHIDIFNPYAGLSEFRGKAFGYHPISLNVFCIFKNISFQKRTIADASGEICLEYFFRAITPYRRRSIKHAYHFKDLVSVRFFHSSNCTLQFAHLHKVMFLKSDDGRTQYPGTAEASQHAVPFRLSFPAMWGQCGSPGFVANPRRYGCRRFP